VSPVKPRTMFREGQSLPLKDMVELERRWKLMEGTKPWTLANRIKLLTTRSVLRHASGHRPAPRGGRENTLRHPECFGDAFFRAWSHIPHSLRAQSSKSS
jgi:hypothetical protein